VVSGIHESPSIAKTSTASSHPYPLRVFAVVKGGYTGLLLFIVIVGLPIVTIPSLRNRLSERISVLRAAISGDITPATAQVGANPEGLPKEYETPAPAVPYHSPPAPTEKKGHTIIVPGSNAPEIRKVPKQLRIIEVPSRESLSEPPLEQTTSSAPTVSKEPEPEVKYQQGNGEQNAYNMLMRSSTAISGLRNNPSLHFISWGAIRKGEDVYWVRLRFQSEETPGEVDYIWEVKLQTSEIIPLSFNAKGVH
jgi:hypothetical protein